jgi:hypothetical protein
VAVNNDFSGRDHAGAGGVGPSLVPNRESVAAICPKKAGWWLISESTAQMVPMGCGASRCEVCGPAKARATAGAIGLASPDRFFTLTQVGDSWQEVRNRVKQVRHELSRRVGPIEFCWHVEPNPKGTGHHVHAWEHGPFIPQKLLSEVADRQGMGRVVDVRKWKPVGGPDVTYGLKLAGVGYGLKMMSGDDTEAFDLYMRSNGERFVHSSRGYFRGSDGEHLSLRAARQEWSAACADDPGPWVPYFSPKV